jgi:microcompartment protein CcmL/EutN
VADAIGIIELSSIASGYVVADAMVKTASVDLAEACPICPGKFVVIVRGAVADVHSALDAGRAMAGSHIVDTMELANVHPEVLAAMSGVSVPGKLEALGIVETFTIAAGVLAADAAAKAADVRLIEVRLARGQGGKAFVSLTGSVASAKAAIEAAEAAIAGGGSLVNAVVIPAPDESLSRFAV